MESILKTDLEKKVLSTCEKVLQAEGFRVVDMDLHLMGRSLIRVFIEPTLETPDTVTPQDLPVSGKKSTSIDDCVKATHALGAALESEDVVPGAYDLEVSSPGLDRRLRLKSDFETFIGQKVKLKLTKSFEGFGANLAGTLSRVLASSVVLMTDGKTRELEIPFENIKRANLVWDFPKNH